MQADEWRSRENDPRFQDYVAKFNAAEFFAAHEAMEELWISAGRGATSPLRGLVQLAVALEHHVRGNPGGARRVLAKAHRNLAERPPNDWNIGQVLAEAGRLVANRIAAEGTAAARRESALPQLRRLAGGDLEPDAGNAAGP